MNEKPDAGPRTGEANWQQNLRVVLVSPRNPLNIGAAARAMSNFGFFRLRLVNPYDVAFKEAKSAVNAHALLEDAQVYATVAEAIADCGLVVGTTSLGPRALEHPMRRLEVGGKQIARTLTSGPVALLFGSEKYGLSNEDISYCQWLIRIPTRDEHGSMNLGQAVAVCLYELIRQPATAHAIPEEKRPAEAESLERITEILETVLRQSGYVHSKSETSTEMKVRRLIRRMQMNARDAELWMGMLRQIRWRLEHPESKDNG